MKKPEQNAAAKAKYQQMWDVTAEVIQKWDPYELLAGGAPSDEWDSEISSVVAQIARIHSPSDAAEAIARVFGANLEREAFKPEACSQVGAELYARLQERGLIA
jgi:hypothetical protein